MSTLADARIRPAVAADLPEVVGLIRALASFEKLPGPDDEAARRLASDFAAGRFELLVAERAGSLVAYALHFMTYSSFLARPTLYLEDLFVHPDARKRGIGRAMLLELARLAARRGCGRFEWVVLDWNTGAQAFYRSLGAQVMHDWWVCRLDGEALTKLAAPRGSAAG